MRSDRLSTAFHETFALSLPASSAIMRLSEQTKGTLSPTTIRAATSLGTNYVKAMPRYARGCGLLDMGSYNLTPLGEAVSRHDPYLADPKTLWLMHYHLTAPHGPGPAFWSHLVTRCLPFGEEVTDKALAAEVDHFLSDQPGASALQERTIRSTITAFLGTYTKSDGLGSLRLLREVAPRSGRYHVSESQSPPPSVVAYALADYWQFHFPDHSTLNLAELARDDGFARIMWMAPQQLDAVLDELRRSGVLDVYRTAPPYQVAWSHRNVADLTARIYE